MMKKLLILFTAAVLFSCENNTGFVVNIDMADLAGTSLEIRQTVDGELNMIDSVILDESGRGTMTGTIEEPEIMHLAISGENTSMQLFMDNYEYNVSGTFADPVIGVSGGPQADYNDYLERTMHIQLRQKETLDRYFASRGAGVDADSMNRIMEVYGEIMAEKEVFDSAYMIENPASMVSVYLLRGNYHALGAEELESKLAMFDPSVHGNKYYRTMSEHLERLKAVAIGQPYIDLELPGTDGEMVKLSDIAGRGVLLLDFWASWCGPCRRANPGVVELYNEFSPKGFDIVGISLDRTKEDWLRGIEEDGLVWHHMSDLNYWQSEAAKTYGVVSIPHTVLLDANGTIIARNLSREELRSKLTELLGS